MKKVVCSGGVKPSRTPESASSDGSDESLRTAIVPASRCTASIPLEKPNRQSSIGTNRLASMVKQCQPQFGGVTLFGMGAPYPNAQFITESGGFVTAGEVAQEIFEIWGRNIGCAKTMLGICERLDAMGRMRERDEAFRVCRNLLDESNTFRRLSILEAWNPSVPITSVVPIGSASTQFDVVGKITAARDLELVAGRSLQRVGKAWQFNFDGKQVPIPDSVGMQHISILIQSPNKELLALDLRTIGQAYIAVVGDCVQLASTASGKVGSPKREPMYRRSRVVPDPIMDRQAIGAIREELRKLNARRTAAIDQGDSRAAASVAADIKDLEKYLKGKFCRDGGLRQFSSDDEKARKAVSNAINAALGAMKLGSVELHAHLMSSLRRGIFMSYAPQSDPIRFI